MKIFDKILGNTPKESRPKTNDSLTNVVLDWFNTGNIDLTLFREKYLDPVITILKAANNYTEKYFSEFPEEANQQYFDVLAGLYLAFYTQNQEYIGRLTEVVLQEKNVLDHRAQSARNLLFRGFDWKMEQQNPEVFSALNTGSYLIKINHAISVRKNSEIGDINTICNTLKAAKFYADSTRFEILFNYVNKQSFFEKPYVIFEVFRHKQFDYKDKNVLVENPHQEHITTALATSINDFNTTADLRLDLTILLDFEKVLDYPYDAKWTNTDYKKRKYLKIKDFESFQRFIEKTKGKEALTLQNLFYHFIQSAQWGGEPEKLFAELFVQIIGNFKADKSWIEKLLSQKHHVQLFYLQNIYFPLIKNIKNELQYSDAIISHFETYTFTAFGDYKHPLPDKDSVNILREIVQKIPDQDERFLYLQRLNPYFALLRVSYDERHISLAMDDSDKKYPTLKAMIDDLNQIIPVGLKGVHKKNHFVSSDDPYNSSFFTLNHQGNDLVITNAFVLDLNHLLESQKAGYRLVPIPIIPNKNKNTGHTHVSALAFLSYNEYQYALNHFIAVKFPDLQDSNIYRNIRYDITDAVPFWQLKSQTPPQSPSVADSNQFLADINWAWFKDKYVDQLSSKEQWYDIMDSAIQCPAGKKPTPKWLETINSRIDQIGKDKYFKELQVLLAASLKEDFWYFDTFRTGLKGLIWTCTQPDATDESLNIVRGIIENAYTKVAGIGPRSSATGNLALETLVATGKEEAFGLLNIMRNKTKYNRFAAVLEKYIDKFKEVSAVPEQLLADKAIPKFGFIAGVKYLSIGDTQLKLHFEGEKLIKIWITPDGKSSKSAPGELSEKYPKLLKEATEEVKQINTVFSDLGKRLRTYWLYDRTWSGKDWLAYLYEHPLVNPHLQDQIWSNKTRGTDFIIRNNQMITINETSCSIDPDDEICFWHPVVNSESNINEWQNYLWEHKIVQRERQAFREHYPFSATELAAGQTERFAHHFLEVKKLMAIANSAGWIFTYVHEGQNWPRVYLKPLDITAHLQCDYTRSDFAIPTKALFFTAGNSTKINDHRVKPEHIEIARIPLTTLSEICRDIDLFIATTSVSNSPELASNRQELNHYRMDYEKGLFSENASAAIRKKIIRRLIPVLNLNSTGFDGNYLLIQGSLNSYRINLGSGFAQVKDTQKHINIIPEVSTIKKNKKVSLPIEDDDTLYMILAKALFLQNDASIRDEKILAILR